jgi:hypothetical protein
MQNFVFTAPLLEVPREYRAHVTRRNRITFNIFGEGKGNTTIALLNRKGEPIASLLVSVKEKITKTVAFCLLSDIRRLCPFTSSEIPPILSGVQKVFKQQANIELNQRGSLFTVNVTSNLGDPIIMEKPEIRSAILRATPQNAILADFCVYFTWDVFSLQKGQIVGQNFGFDCYVEKQLSPFDNAITTAHELGHGLGLSHNGAQTLMAGDGNLRSSKLHQFEIDLINQTDN